MSQNRCKNCNQNILGTVYQITVNREVDGNYCQSCYEKLPVGIRPYDHRGSGICQNCKTSQNCGKNYQGKNVCKDNCLDSISLICGECWGEERSKCLSCRLDWRKGVHVDENRMCETCRKGKPEIIDKSNLTCKECKKPIKAGEECAKETIPDAFSLHDVYYHKSCFKKTQCSKCSNLRLEGRDLCFDCSVRQNNRIGLPIFLQNLSSYQDDNKNNDDDNRERVESKIYPQETNALIVASLLIPKASVTLVHVL